MRTAWTRGDGGLAAFGRSKRRRCFVSQPAVRRATTIRLVIPRALAPCRLCCLPNGKLLYGPMQTTRPSVRARNSRPLAAARLSQAGATLSLYWASFSPVAAEAAQSIPPMRPS